MRAVLVALILLASTEARGQAHRAPNAPIVFGTLTAGDKYTCGLSSGGRAYCWGADYLGQLGIGVAPSKCGDLVVSPGMCARAPVPVAGDHQFVALSAAKDHACAIDVDGEAYCWGASSRQRAEGQVLDGCDIEGPDLGKIAGMPCSLTPVKVLSSASFTAIAAGLYGTCALDDRGRAWCWGLTGDATEPTEVPLDGKRLTSLSMAENRGCGLATDSSAVCWDWPEVQEKGYTTPTDTMKWVVLAVAKAHACAVDASGRAWCWGNDADGALGTSDPHHRKFDESPPAPVAGDHRFRSIAVSTTRSCAIELNGAMYCWGYVPEVPQHDRCLDSNGLSDMQHCTASPVLVHPGTQFRLVALGENHQCAIAATGAAYCWGANDWGELGNGTRRESTKLLAVADHELSPSELRMIDVRERVTWLVVRGGIALLVLVALGWPLYRLGLIALAWWRRGAQTPRAIGVAGLGGWPGSEDSARAAGLVSIVAVLLGWGAIASAFSSVAGNHSHDEVSGGLAVLAILMAGGIAIVAALVGGILALVTLRNYRATQRARVGLTLAATTLVVLGGMWVRLMF